MMLREALRSVSSVEKGTRSTLRTLYPWHYSLATRSLANNVESQSTKQPNHTNNDKIKPFSEMPGRRNKFLNYLDMFRKGGVSKLTDYVIWRSNTIGPVWRENIGVLQVMITDPEAAAIVWRAEGKYPRRAPFEPWLLYRKRCGYALGVFLAEGEDWHRHRSVVQKPLLRPKSVALHNNALNEVADDLIAKMKTGRDENNVMATMDDDLFRWAMEGVGTVLFEKRIGLIGKGVNEEAERFISAVRDFFGYSERLIFFPLKYQEKFNMSAWKGMVKAARTQFEITERFMNEKLEDMKKTRSEAATTDVEEKQFVKYMYSTGKLTDKEILANLTEMFGAAVDTTTNTVIFILDLLAWNPEAQEKLYQEIKNVIPEGKSVSQEYLKELHYLKAVVKESMRLRPVTPLLVRILDTDVVLCGYNVPAGKVLTIHSTAMGRNPKLFPNPEKFLPDRWLRSNKESHDINQFTIQPFGFGPRQCVGRRVAELEIYITLTKILQNFRLEPNSDKPLEMTTRLITVPATKLNLKFRDRD